MSTLADETAGDVPVKDISFQLTRVGGLQETSAAQNARERQAVSRVSREELEDRFLRLHEENLLLKQYTHKQEDKIKRMVTKLVRLVKDRKREEQAGPRVRDRGRDVETEEMMEELQEKVQELERQNEGLRQRLITAKQQLQLQGRRHARYDHVPPRINTGLHRPRDDGSTPQQRTPSRGLRNIDVSARATQTQLPRYGHSLLDEARAEIRNLENAVESQREQMEDMDRAAEILREQLRRKEREFEESLLQLREQQACGQRSTIKDNVEMIKLQKQLTEKGNAFTVLEGRFRQLQESQRALKGSHDAVMAKVDELSGLLKEERLRSLELEKQLQASSLAQRRTEELQDRIQDLEKERDLLKENHEKLLNSAFDVTLEQKWKTSEQQLRLQIAQLEVALKSDLTDKNQILDKIKLERELNESLSQQNQELQLRFLEQKQQLDEIRDRMKFFTKESDTDVAELSEALMLIKVRKTQRNGDLGFLEKVEEDVHQDLERSMRDLQATHAETVQELEKTRNMLIVQHKINKEYQTEVEAVTRKMEDIKVESEQKLERLAQLLDARAARIRKLEAQLKDIAYGTKAHVFKPDITEEDAADEFDETIHLERGENLFEIHIGQAHLSPGALGAMGDPEPTTFCTFAFYDFELQATPVVRGSQPNYGYTSQYKVSVDDLFLHHLQGGAVVLELQLARGLEYQTVAACQLRLREVLDQKDKVLGTSPLIGVTGEVQSFGTLDYWLRLRVPVERAVRLYRERAKALGYLSSSHSPEPETQQASAAPDKGSLNELHVTVRRCSDLRPHRPDAQPSPYAVYKLYDFPDHDTRIVPCSNHPQFDDHVAFPVAMNADLDRYLKAEDLSIYVFDDRESESQLYLGKARVPLISLAHDKGITGTFELTDPDGRPSGTVEVTLKWRRSYLPPPGASMTVEQAKFFAKEAPERLVAEEEMASAVPRLPTAPPSETFVPKPRQRTLLKDGVPSKKVCFVEDAVSESPKAQERSLPGSGDDEKAKEKSPGTPELERVRVVEVARAPQGANNKEEEEADEEEESHFSEGQLATPNSWSSSQEPDLSDEIPALEQVPDAEDTLAPDLDELSDSDDCIVEGQADEDRKQPSQRIRVEITSLSLAPDSRAATDDSVSRLFVEYRFLDLPSVETPLSLPKPRAGRSIHYNYSSVIDLDMEGYRDRREMLRSVLRGQARQLESMKFTVVSDPPEDDQDQECEDVGVAFLRIPEILELGRDLTDASLDILDVQDHSVLVGSLKVTVEALGALQSVLKDPLLSP